MKKLLLTLLVLAFSINSAFSAETSSCLIKDQTSPHILDYVNNNTIILNNIRRELSKSSNTGSIVVQNWNKATSSIIRVYNSFFDFENYISYFDYYVRFPMMNDVPYSIKRDYDILKREYEKIEKYYKDLVKSGKMEVQVTELCKTTGTENLPNCSGIEKGKAEDIVAKLLENADNILALYRRIVMYQNSVNDSMFDVENDSTKNLLLVGNDFVTQMKKYYNKTEYQKCSQEDGFMARVTKRLEQIGQNFINQKDGIQSWIEAINLARKSIGSGLDEKKERELFEKELSRQGISGSAKQRLLDALNTFNTEGFIKSNPLTNIGENLKSTVTKGLEEFKNLGNILKINTGDSISSILKSQENFNVTKEIKDKVERMYKNLQYIAVVEHKNTLDLQKRIIYSHNSINEAIIKLTNNCETAVKVCNSQATGIGICGTCN